jgi:hypothetical protein
LLQLIAVPSVVELLEKAKEEVCLANRLELRENYLAYLQIEEVETSPEVFSEFLNKYGEEICPEHGVVIYERGEVLYSIHSGPSEEEESEGVPFL